MIDDLYYIDDLSQADERLAEIKAKEKVLTPKEREKLYKNVANIFERYEHDMEQKQLEAERAARRADYCLF